MKVAVFSAKPYDEQFLNQANQKFEHALHYFENHLNEQTALLAKDFPAVCVFTNDVLTPQALRILSEQGTRLIALRCAGYNNINLTAAREYGIQIVRVPEYSPYAIAEHTVGLILTLNRKIHKAYNRVREGNFTLNGLLGFDLHGKTVGIIGTGRIGAITANILKGFGCRILAYDLSPCFLYEEHGVQYVELPELFAQSDIITLHCPLTTATRHLINAETLSQMKNGVMLINTSRGGVIDTAAVIQSLKSGKIGYLGLDVYEEESEIFFEDFSMTGINDDMLARLLTFPNVLITSHQAFFTKEALENIAHTTLANITTIENELHCENEVLLLA
jgi:D-lactate dehydrogenase